ncbi:ribonuclease 3-like isoform X2 [Corticium candelabrum]|uniref:ribonuclease 3-like isoform X2 n=1 Tax=Corticium candelabrum TaxID=121492 RepID=UPI002E2567C8|nr:ribonuclease 3-like isoform X2 [Corticium candelabrum]
MKKARRDSCSLPFYRRVEPQSEGTKSSTVVATDELCSLHKSFKEALLECRSAGRENIESTLSAHAYHKDLDATSLDPLGNNLKLLHVYSIHISPDVNFQLSRPTTILCGESEYKFQGFCLISSVSLSQVPCCNFVLFDTTYTASLTEMPDNSIEMFCLVDLDILTDFTFCHLLDLSSWQELQIKEDNNRLYLLPCFSLEDAGWKQYREQSSVAFLPTGRIMQHILESSQHDISYSTKYDIIDELFIWPQKAPSAIRVDDIQNQNDGRYIIHWSNSRRVFNSQEHNDKVLSETRKYKRCHRKQRMGLSVGSKKSYHMDHLRGQTNSGVNQRVQQVSCHVSGGKRTGLKSDITQNALVMPAVFEHIRHFLSLASLESDLSYTFKDKSLLQTSLTHSSFTVGVGNIESSLIQRAYTNCGPRYIMYGSCQVSRLYKKKQSYCKLSGLKVEDCSIESFVDGHNQCLQFLGDAVIYYVTTLHLFHLFPDLSEGSLSMYRKAIVENTHLTILAKGTGLNCYMRAHVSNNEQDGCLAGCLKAVFGAIYLDGGMPLCQKSIAQQLEEVWMNYSRHPLQREAGGDRHLIEKSLFLKELTGLECSINVQFHHICLLARAFTHSSVGFNYLTLGSYERLEWLGDAVLQLLVSNHLYERFLNYDEGYLTLLRTSLVNRIVQFQVAVELGLDKYIKVGQRKLERGSKLLSDVFEAFIAALLLDQGMEVVAVFVDVCLFQRLQHERSLSMQK